MRGPYQMFGLDPALASGAGIWVDYGEFRVRIRRAGPGNPAWLVALAEVFVGVTEGGIGLAEAEALPLLAECYARAIVTDWQGVCDEQGRELACTQEAVRQVLCDLPELFADLRLQAERLELFRARREAEIEGN